MLTLRLGKGHSRPEFFNPLIETLKRYPECCDEVWLCSQVAYPKIETHEEIADAFAVMGEAFRKLGIRVSLQITNTLGHGQSVEMCDSTGLLYEGSPARRMIGHDGQRADFCLCCTDPVMRDYTAREIKAYASRVKPHTVWIDDDLRPEYHHPVLYPCFCEDCMARFNALHQSAHSREALVKLINRDLLWRDRWVNFMRDNLYDFTAFITKAVMDVSPDIVMAYQYPFVTNYAGADNRFFFDAMHDVSGMAPKSRAGHSFYSDDKPIEMLEKAYRIHFCNRLLPDYVVDRRAEIENIPDVPFCKTTFGTLTESTLDLAFGCNQLTYAVLGGLEPMSWHEKMLRAFAEHRPYWEKLAKASDETKFGGVAIAIDEKMHLYSADEADFEWVNHRWPEATRPARYGMPLGFDEDAAQVMLLTKALAEALPDAVIEKLLKRPTITQANAVDVLIKRGFDMGVRLTPIPTVAAREQYTSHPVNGAYAGQYWRVSFTSEDIWAIAGDGVEALSCYVSTFEDGKDFGIASSLITLPGGVKWVVLGSGLTDTIVSSARRNQILAAADAICGRKLPSLIENADKLTNIPRVDDQGRVVCVSILHHGIGPTEDPVVVRIRNPRGTRFTFWDGATSGLELKAERAGNDYIVTLPRINGWDIGTVFCE